MKALVAMAIAASLCGTCAADDARADARSAIQGIWRGTGRDESYTLVFCGDVLIGMVGTDPLVGNKESGFRVDIGTIDIQRAEGLQMGCYAIDGDTLTLVLVDVNRPRPNSIGVVPAKPTATPPRIDRKNRTPPTQRRYVFERQTKAARN
jgi:hypothetical protein